MKDIGIRELKKKASALVRHVAESREPYTITRRGKAVAVLSPLRPGLEESPAAPEAWNRFEQLADRLSRQPSRSAVRELSRMRR
jgi:prevent-host-death family protein